jgi:cell division protein FtsN
MSKNSNRPSNRSSEFPVFAGILLGMVMGLAIAGVIAWFVLKKNPVPTPIKEPSPALTPAKPAAEKPVIGKPAAAGTASATGEGKARFEFYKELTDKPDPASKKNDRHVPAPIKPEIAVKPADKANTYFLQEGAYTTPDDAEKVKAKLALLGMVATVQPANIPDKGVWYRVRLGPYKNVDEMNEALASLKLNGLNAAPIKAP